MMALHSLLRDMLGIATRLQTLSLEQE